MNLPEQSVNRPIMVYMFTTVMILLGAVSFIRLPVDLMPEMQSPTLSVRAEYPGVAPEEVENLVARPLESTLSAAPGIYRINSTSSEGSANIRIQFDYGVNMDEAANEIRTRLDRARGSLPEGVLPPTVFKFDTSQMPIMSLAVSGSKGQDARELRTLLEKDIQPRLERVGGVAAVDIRGGLRREIHVTLSTEKLRSYNLSVNQIVTTLRNENQNRPVGPMEEGKYEVLLRTQGEFQDVKEISNVVVAARGGTPIYLRDIAKIDDTHEEIRQMVRIDDQPSVRFSIRKQSGTNTVTVAENVRAELARLEKSFPDIKVFPMFDSSQFITKSINNLNESAIEGGILAVIALLLFLRNIRSTMIVAISIPITVVGTFILMYAYDFTLNTMSFGALALSVGMIVDNAIVIIENVFRHREQGYSHAEAAVMGTSEVAGPLVASTLTSVAVFVPLLFVGGQSGIMFKQLAWIVGFSQIFSLVIGLTLVPVLCSKYLRVRKPDDNKGFHPLAWLVRISGKMLDTLDENYQRAIHWSLTHRKTVIASAALLFVGSLALTQFIGVEMTPETDEGEVRVSVELAAGTRVEITDEIAKRMETIIRKEVPETKHIMSEVGGGGFMSSSMHTADMSIQLKDKAERQRSSTDIVNALRPKLNLQPGMLVRVRSQSNNMMMNRRGGGGGERVSVEIRGFDMAVASDIAKRVKDIIDGIPGITDSQVSRREGFPEMLVRVDRDKAASLGLNASDIASTLETVIGGRRASQFRQEGEEFNILVRLNEEQRANIAQLQNITVVTPGGQAVPIGNLVTVQRREGPVSIERQDQERMVRVTAGYAKRDLGSIMKDVDQRLNGMSMPSGFSIFYGGEYEEQQKSFRELLFALILAIVLVYMVMAAQFESLRDPLIILFSIPLAAIGVVLALFLTETTFNQQAFIGTIMLAGIAVNNAIVLIDYTNLLRERDKLLLRHAVELAGRRRLRPILMTTLTAIVGLLPMALGLGEGSEVQSPMARVVIGGLTTSTLITLLFIPTIYTIIEERGHRKAATEIETEGMPQPLQPMGAD